MEPIAVCYVLIAKDSEYLDDINICQSIDDVWDLLIDEGIEDPARLVNPFRNEKCIEVVSECGRYKVIKCNVIPRMS